MTQRLFKIVSAELWAAAQQDGQFRGAEIDLADGFIHLSSADQVVETAEKHFAGRQGLLLVTVDGDQLGDALRWETSRGGALFPHVYGVIPMDAVLRVDPLLLGDDGRHQISI